MAYQALAHLSVQPALPPSDVDETSQPGRRIGAYVLEELLGKGGMGEVYRAHDTRLHRTVAIKVVSAERSAERGAATKLAHEARVASALSHPGIVAVYDIGEFEGRPYIVMELVEGESLASRLQWRPLSVREALNVGAQVAEALAAAHAAGVVHRDLKPQNIMLTADGRAKIVDFGLGTFLRDSSVDRPGDTRTRTIRLSVEGTAGYMAPEQAAGRPVDMRADQFALGVILYEMVSGWRAFVRETEIQTLSDIIDAEPAPLKQICPRASAALVAIVDRCLQKDPRDRYGSTLDLAHDLRVAADEPSRSHWTIGLATRPANRAWTWPAAGAAALLAALLMAAPQLSTSASMPGRAAQLGEQERQINARQALLHSKLADVYSMLGRKADTLEAVAAVERLGSGNAEAMFNVANSCERVGERTLALQWLRKAVAAGYPRESIAQSPGLAKLMGGSGM